MSTPLGQILPGSAFGNRLTELAREADTILEIGTWRGEGSTRCLANGLVYPEQRLWTIEQDPNVHAEAKARYDDPRITFIRGHALEVIDQLPEKIDLCLFDGDDLSTITEFGLLKDRCTVVALDDTNELKCRDIAKTLRAQSEDPRIWSILNDEPKDRQGWMTARRHNGYDALYLQGGWDGKGSGPGSTQRFTLEFRGRLEAWMEGRNIRSVFDYGCGDWSWQRFVQWGNRRYIGWDMSYVAIQTVKNLPEYTRNPEAFTFVGDPFARPHRFNATDLLIVKDVMHHATFEERERIVDMSKQFPWVLWVLDMEPNGRPCFWPKRELPKWELFHQFDLNVEDYRYGPKYAFIQRNK